MVRQDNHQRDAKEDNKRDERLRSKGLMSVLKKILFALTPLVVVLVVVEVICRLLPDSDMGKTRAGLVVPDPDLMWTLKPTTDSSFATNELGFRDTPYRADADVKILLLGDSVSWGDGVGDVKLCYPYLLEQHLAATNAPRSYEVVNSGVPGYSTFQEAQYLQKKGLDLQPNLVVLQVCLNDVVERYLRLAQYGGDNVFLGIDTREGIPGAFGFAMRNCKSFELLMRYLQRRSRRREAYDVEKLAQDQLSPELEEAWENALEEIETIRRVTEQNRIPLLLVIAPYQFQMADPGRRSQPQQRLVKYARSKGIPYVDLLPGFVEFARDRGLVGTQLFNDPSHFSIFGHEAAAKLLATPVQGTLRTAK